MVDPVWVRSAPRVACTPTESVKFVRALRCRLPDWHRVPLLRAGYHRCRSAWLRSLYIVIGCCPSVSPCHLILTSLFSHGSLSLSLSLLLYMYYSSVPCCTFVALCFSLFSLLFNIVVAAPRCCRCTAARHRTMIGIGSLSYE